jgi:broad specificity phosphatase PhoE
MVTIIFEPHSTTLDNEAYKASGHNDVELSKTGEEQAKDMGERYKGKRFDAIFCSDLQRAYKTAHLAFGKRFPVVQDSRLRECDYGDFTGRSKKEVDAEKPSRINKPFPNGESYEQVSARMKSFLYDLFQEYDGKTVLIIGHQGTHYGLKKWARGLTLQAAIAEPLEWQPGWTYRLQRAPAK